MIGENGASRQLVNGSVFGIRVFKAEPFTLDGGIYSLGIQHLWKPGINEAKCGRMYEYDPLRSVPKADHRAGSRGCFCGFYAFWQEKYAAPAGKQRLGGIMKGEYRKPVVGIVEATGVITCGERGFRAERAKIVCFTNLNHVDSAVEGRIRERYPDIPVLGRWRAKRAFPLGGAPEW